MSFNENSLTALSTFRYTYQHLCFHLHLLIYDCLYLCHQTSLTAVETFKCNMQHAYVLNDLANADMDVYIRSGISVFSKVFWKQSFHFSLNHSYLMPFLRKFPHFLTFQLTDFPHGNFLLFTFDSRTSSMPPGRGFKNEVSLGTYNTLVNTSWFVEMTVSWGNDFWIFWKLNRRQHLYLSKIYSSLVN